MYRERVLLPLPGAPSSNMTFRFPSASLNISWSLIKEFSRRISSTFPFILKRMCLLENGLLGSGLFLTIVSSKTLCIGDGGHWYDDVWVGIWLIYWLWRYAMNWSGLWLSVLSWLAAPSKICWYKWNMNFKELRPWLKKKNVSQAKPFSTLGSGKAPFFNRLISGKFLQKPPTSANTLNINVWSRSWNPRVGSY